MRLACYIFGFLLVITDRFPTIPGIRWLALAKMGSLGSVNTNTVCDKLSGLIKRQRSVCRRNLDMMDSVRNGATMAISECQWQFNTRRWNCSITGNGSGSGSIFGSAISQGTREAAFVHAISAAGVAHSVTRGCSSGQLEKCGCDRTVRGKSSEGFMWSGCSDNIAFGNAFSKAFVDARERHKGPNAGRALMNLHNNEAGRKAIEHQMKVDCKCHGVSGSCELKTCWRAMPSFREVGRRLKDKFDGATEVTPKRVGSRSKLIPVNKQFKPHTNADLVYLVESPDFCERDPKSGSLGTHGRKCNKTSKAIDGCDLMCCGRGYVSRKRIVVERCSCKFHWCCYVRCKQCKREVEEHYCL